MEREWRLAEKKNDDWFLRLPPGDAFSRHRDLCLVRSARFGRTNHGGQRSNAPGLARRRRGRYGLGDLVDALHRHAGFQPACLGLLRLAYGVAFTAGRHFCVRSRAVRG